MILNTVTEHQADFWITSELRLPLLDRVFWNSSKRRMGERIIGIDRAVSTPC
jgi:hypothetical protein